MDKVDFKEFIEKVRQANDIVEVVSEYVVLKRAGSKFKSLSPFKKEKTPSFFVDPQKQLFKCFSSGYGGTVFDFIMYYEKLDFIGALKHLARRAGLSFPSSFRYEEQNESLRQKQKLWELHEAVAEYWTKILVDEPSGEPARAYLKERNIDLCIAKEFGLGYALNSWDGLLRWASTKKGLLEMLEPAGLVVRTEHSKIYDRFRGRLMFRITDEAGKVVGFSGRLIEGEQGPKYLNSPESPIFTKGKILYGFHKAKRAIAETGKAILCEGHIDLIRLHAAGFSTAVATQGTALTEHQAGLLKRFCSEVFVAYDGDRAGEEAALRASDILLAEGLEIKIAQLPPGEDPDSLISKKGREAFEKVLEEALPYPSFVLNKACLEYSPQQAFGKSKIAEKMAGLLIKISDPVRRHTASLEVAARLGISLEIFEQKMAQLDTANKRPEELNRKEDQEKQSWGEKIPPVILETLWFLMEYPQFIAHFKETFPAAVLSDMPAAELLIRLYDFEEAQKKVSISSFLETLSQEQKGIVVSFMFHPLQEKPEGYTPEEHCRILQEGLFLLWRQKCLERIKLQSQSGILSGQEISAKLKEIVDLARKLL